jgi:hypothetical protein
MGELAVLLLGWGLSADDHSTRECWSRVAAVYLAFDSGATRQLSAHADPEVRRLAAEAATHWHRRVIAARHEWYLKVDPVYAWCWGPPDPAPMYRGPDRDREKEFRRLVTYIRECGVSPPDEDWPFDPDGKLYPKMDFRARQTILGIRSVRERLRGELDSRTGTFDYPKLKPGYGPGLPTWKLPLNCSEPSPGSSNNEWRPDRSGA